MQCTWGYAMPIAAGFRTVVSKTSGLLALPSPHVSLSPQKKQRFNVYVNIEDE